MGFILYIYISICKNMSNILNETFRKHIKLLHKKLNESGNHFDGSENLMIDLNGVKRSVPIVVKFAEKNKEKYFIKDFPISELEHNLEWWDKQNKEDPDKSNKRMMNADTRYPLLVIKHKNNLSVGDGLNRLKKTRDVEKKKTIDIYLVPEEDMPEESIVR